MTEVAMDYGREALAKMALNHWESINERRGELIERNVDGLLSEKEQVELAWLQQVADMRIHILAPPPTEQLLELLEQALERSQQQVRDLASDVIHFMGMSPDDVGYVEATRRLAEKCADIL